MDELDRAAIEEARALDRALAAQHARAHRPHRLVTDAHGTRLCRDCGDPLTPARLTAHPGAVRCVPCQSAHERGAR